MALSEKEKMVAGLPYNPVDRELVSARVRAKLAQDAFNSCAPDNGKELKRLLNVLVPNQQKSCFVQPPFYCDYGFNLHLGERVFLNFNCVALDAAPIRIGHNSMLGPNVQLYTATHPLNAQQRASGVESAKPITIGNDVWIGGNVTICPGVTIGNGTVIGAGSVITKNIPANVMAAGNPCKVIKPISTNDF